MYLFQEGKKSDKRVQLFGCGSILNEVIAGAEILRDEFGVEADIWSTTSINELTRDAMAVARWNMLHPEAEPRESFLQQQLKGHEGPVIASTDYMRMYAEQLRAYIPRNYKVLGTDGFGRSDTRAKLRSFFEVNRYYVAVAALKALQEEGKVEASVVANAIQKFNINPDAPAPWTV